MKDYKRKTNSGLLRSVHARVRRLKPEDLQALHERLELLHAFERVLLDERILEVELPQSRTSLAIDKRIGGPQAAQLERKMLTRVLGILHNAKLKRGKR